MLDISTLDSLLCSRLDISQMPDGDILERWQEDVDFRGEESVHLSLALELCSELGCSYLLVLAEDLSMSSPRRYLSVVIHQLECRYFEGCVFIIK